MWPKDYPLEEVMLTRSIKLNFAVVTLVSALAACGGGGGGDDATTENPVPPVTTPPVTNPGGGTTDPGDTAGGGDNSGGNSGSIVTSPGQNDYGNSEQGAAYDYLNTARLACGFGALRQNTKLDAASAGHASYMLANNTIGHGQVETLDGVPATGYTGAAPWTRATAAGYVTRARAVAESIAVKSGNPASVKLAGRGQESVRELLAAPYHAIWLLAGFRDIGVSVQAAQTASGVNRVASVLNLGYLDAEGPQLIESSGVRTYPCDGVNGTAYQLTDESPNPVPGRDLAKEPLGQPILVMGRQDEIVKITSAVVLDQSGQSVKLRTPVDYTTDPEMIAEPNCVVGCFVRNTAYVIPDQPLKQGSVYSVNIAGTSNGIAWTRNFQFTTGN